MAKRVLNTVYDGPLHVGLELEGLAYGLLQQTHDFHEGVEAFVEKRSPSSTGREPRYDSGLERPHGALGRAHARRERLGARELTRSPGRASSFVIAGLAGRELERTRASRLS